MAVNKVVFGGETIINLTNDTVTPDTLAEGVTAHDASGKAITGRMAQTGGEAMESHYFEGTIGNYPYYVWVDIYPNNRAHWYGYTKNPTALTGMQIGSSGIYRITTGAAFPGLRLCNPTSTTALGSIEGYVYQPVDVTGVYYSADALGTGWGTVGAYTGVLNTTSATLYTYTSTVAASSIIRFDVVGTYKIIS
jgi:hypothetical protein